VGKSMRRWLDCQKSHEASNRGGWPRPPPGCSRFARYAAGLPAPTTPQHTACGGCFFSSHGLPVCGHASTSNIPVDGPDREFYSKASTSDGWASAARRAVLRTTPTPSITPSATPPALSPPSLLHRRSSGGVRLLLSSPPPCRRWGAYRTRREAGGMGWRHWPASLLRAAVSLRPPISSPPQRRSAGGFERLPGPRRRPWLAAATLTTCRG